MGIKHFKDIKKAEEFVTKLEEEAKLLNKKFEFRLVWVDKNINNVAVLYEKGSA